jgi:hypothetical protein
MTTLHAMPGTDSIHCACGSADFFLFGRYGDGDGNTPTSDPFLAYILTCSKCGEQLRIYQTSEQWREHRKKLQQAQASVYDAADGEQRFLDSNSSTYRDPSGESCPDMPGDDSK